MPSRLGEKLLEQGLISAEDLDEAIAVQQKTKQYLGKILLESGRIDERALLQVLAEQHDIAFMDLRHTEIPPDVIAQVPAKFARHYNIMPVSISENVMTVATADPFDVWPMDDLQTHIGCRVEKVLSPSEDIQEAIARHYGVAADTIERIMAEEPRTETSTAGIQTGAVEDLEKMAGDASVIQLVNQVFHQAIEERATDIHLEYFHDEAALRYRVDGILQDAQVSGDIKYLYPAIVSRIKIMSGLDIIERRLPQDGRARVKIGAREYDLRVSVMPTIHGENVVVRILPTTMLLSLADLGLAPGDLGTLERLIQYTNGILFVTGPTGSGKSTTLYAALKKLNGKERKLVTIEDPVEYQLKGVSQVQVKPKIGLTFARALRSMLRHDPDVIMVGEIRDLETANIAVRAALTGHLVLSTLHTNDAASGVTRLIDIGIQPYLVSSAVRAFIAQRLVRVLCPECKQPYELSDDTLRQFGAEPGRASVTAYRPVGCEACHQRGYRGRTGIYEVITLNEKIRTLILETVSSDALKKAAAEAGMRTLKQDGFEKVKQGVTTPEEVLRVTQMEE